MKKLIIFLLPIFILSCSNNEKKYVDIVSKELKSNPIEVKKFDKINQTLYRWNITNLDFIIENIKNGVDKNFGSVPTKISELEIDHDIEGNQTGTATEYFIWENSKQKVEIDHTIDVKGNNSEIKLSITEK